MRIYDTRAVYIPDPAPGGCPASVNDEDLDETIAKIEREGQWVGESNDLLRGS